jgi:uncharacterized protein YsxB (DUF464 family)
MITVIVRRDSSGIREIEITGHANAAAYGSDIVCAAVSGISIGILNGIEPLLGLIPDVEQAPSGGGFLRWRLGHPDDDGLHEKQQLLAEGMVIALISVAQQYGQYVSVHDAKWQGGASQ